MLDKFKEGIYKKIASSLFTISLCALPSGCCSVESNIDFSQEQITQVYSELEKPGIESRLSNPPKKESIEHEVQRFPILMYHEVDNPEESEYGSRYTVSADMLRSQLDLMHKNNFVPVSLDEYLSDDFSSVPEGKRPYMITFDDATQGQFNYIMDDRGQLKIDPDCAVGVLNQFSKVHDDFNAKAIFFVDFVDKKGYFEVPFRQRGLEKQKIDYLIENGFDVQCHTTLHPFLGKSDYKTLYNNTELYNYLTNYRVNHSTIAYPFGDIPSGSKKVEYIKNNFDVAFGAFGNRFGSKAFRVTSEKFLPYNIPRIEINNDLENIQKYAIN